MLAASMRKFWRLPRSLFLIEVLFWLAMSRLKDEIERVRHDHAF
jgi:hypothetical protein